MELSKNKNQETDCYERHN